MVVKWWMPAPPFRMAPSCDAHVPGQHHVVGQDHAVSDDAVVGDVRVGHQDAVVADDA